MAIDRHGKVVDCKSIDGGSNPPLFPLFINMRKMLFLGDSFTWGEGLELYMNKEPFISMRNQKNRYRTEEIFLIIKILRLTIILKDFQTM